MKKIIGFVVCLFILQFSAAAATNNPADAIGQQISKQSQQKQQQQKLLNNKLFAAVAADNVSVVKKLLEKGANPNAHLSFSELSRQKGEFDVALVIAAAHDNVEIMRSLLEYGADPNMLTEFIPTAALHKVKSVAAAKLLVEEFHADLEIRNFAQETPLMEASAIELLAYYLEKGADINAVDSFHDTVLSWTVRAASFARDNKAYYIDKIRLLTNPKYKVNLEYVGSFNETACDILKKRKHSFTSEEYVELDKLLCEPFSLHYVKPKINLNTLLVK